ncbi:ATP-binding cassette domain-containing protein [candidate division GN15 bacterium]|nr:ATP-binding cassette domain-containing protein [candidate division GN15 bacterium]
MVHVSSLSRSFGDVRAVDNLSFHVRAGESFALLGPNGAGKTTTIKMILGMLRPDSGEIRFQDQVITPDQFDYKARIGYVPESCALYENLSGAEFLGFIGHLHHLPDETVRSKAGRLLASVGLDDARHQLVREYSKGMKQKLLIVSALMHDPDLIILDEPFSGIDANAVSVFKELFRAQAQAGKGIIFCSHILDVVERLVDRCLIIKDGRELASGTPAEIIAQTDRQTLDQAFNVLTGQRDTDTRAREIMDIITNGKKRES